MAANALRACDAPNVETAAVRLADDPNGRERWQGRYRLQRRSWTILAGSFRDPMTAHQAARYAGHKNGD